MTPSEGGARNPTGTVITVVRGGCEVVCGDERRELRLLGRSALRGVELAVGDELEFDPVKGVTYVLMVQRTGVRNGDASDLRKAFQEAVAKALRN